MLRPISLDVQPHVDTVHHAAVETLRARPDTEVIEAGEKALRLIQENAADVIEFKPIIEIVRITREAFNSVRACNPETAARAGHYVVAIAADLGRVVDAVDNHRNPQSVIEHAKSLFASMPRNDNSAWFEIDLSDKNQLARLLQEQSVDRTSETVPPVPDPATDRLSGLDGVRTELKHFITVADKLIESPWDPATLDEVVTSLQTLQTQAATGELEHVGQVVACALRVIEAHRSAGEELPLDALEFVIAVRQIIPMILESLDDPGKVSHAVDALVDQSSFVLQELRHGTRSLADLWPEQDLSGIETNYLGDPQSSTIDINPVPKNFQPGDTESLLNDLSSDSTDSAILDEVVISPEAEHHQVRIAATDLEDLASLASELAVRSSGQEQRSRRFNASIQDVSRTSDRIRRLLRQIQEGKRGADISSLELQEIAADISVAVADLEQVRTEFDALTERQTRVRSRLKERIEKLRMVDVATLVPDLQSHLEAEAANRSLSVRLQLEGESTPVDSTAVDGLREVLFELIDNALEHGIETPEEREQAGKPSEGTIRLRAYRDGSQAVFQLADDGRGVDERALLSRAAERGMPVSRSGVTRERAMQYMFMPGFSTRPVPSEQSQPVGMGLDMVSSRLAVNQGTITASSVPDRGTVFTVRIPLRPALVDAFVVGISGERYVIPFQQIEVLDPDDVTDIEAEDDGYVAIVDGHRWPAADLGSLMGMRSPHHVTGSQGKLLEVLHNNQRWMLRVDSVFEQEMVAVQDIGLQIHQGPGLAGAAVLASGQMATVIDLDQVLDSRRVRIRRQTRQTATLSPVPFALVTDDSISSRRHLARILERSGWRVLEARDGFEARELLDAISPDLVIVDLDLPAHGGLQVIRTARAIGDIPIIALATPTDDSQARERTESLGADAVLPKPVDSDQLLQTLQRVTS